MQNRFHDMIMPPNVFPFQNGSGYVESDLVALLEARERGSKERRKFRDNSQVDEAILSATGCLGRKAALVIAVAQATLGNNLPEGDTGLDLIAKRIEALVLYGRPLAQGNIKKWRYSEVRKPG
jgi:hypothetical protein